MDPSILNHFEAWYTGIWMLQEASDNHLSAAKDFGFEYFGRLFGSVGGFKTVRLRSFSKGWYKAPI